MRITDPKLIERLKDRRTTAGTTLGEEIVRTRKPEKSALTLITPQPDADRVVAFFLANGLPAATPEFKFHPTRRWRFDFAFTEDRLALEVEGGIWTGGRHTSGVGFKKDMEKYNTATALGWRIIRCTPQELYSEETVRFLQESLYYVCVLR